MKNILKVKIQRQQDSEGTHYTYPKEYDPKKFDVLTYESQLSDRYTQVIDRGNDHEYVIGLVEVIDVDSFLKSPDIELITRQEVNVFIGEDLHKYIEKVTDTEAVVKILAKAAKGEKLAKEEHEAIDSSHPRRGINRSKTLNEVLNENGL